MSWSLICCTGANCLLLRPANKVSMAGHGATFQCQSSTVGTLTWSLVDLTNVTWTVFNGSTIALAFATNFFVTGKYNLEIFATRLKYAGLYRCNDQLGQISASAELVVLSRRKVLAVPLFRQTYSVVERGVHIANYYPDKIHCHKMISCIVWRHQAT